VKAGAGGAVQPKSTHADTHDDDDDDEDDE
jgi:hypothetical protein